MRRPFLVLLLLCAACARKSAPSDAAAEDASHVVAFEVGDRCDDPEQVVCARGARSLLRCDGGRFRIATTCRGPAGCAPRPDGGAPACDDSVAEANDACDLEAQIACSVDQRVELRCASGKFVVARVCRKPCEIRGSDLFCD